MSTVDPHSAVPRLGDYRLHDVLGEGGMGVVHLGVDPSGRAVAVKVLRDHVAHDPVARRRLAREVSTLRRVDHPAIAPFLGADVDGPRPYIVTRYIAGDPLDRWVAEHGVLEGERLREFGITLADALEAIHAAGVVHRDLKPANVLMPGGSPVVIDFGIAHVADESRLTSTGLVMGTPGYLPPELLDGQDVSVSTDLWGYASTLAFAATGRPPFGLGHTSAVLDRVRRGAADLDGITPWLADLLRRCLDPDPACRPSPAEVRSALADPGRDMSAPLPPRRPAPVAPRPAAPAPATGAGKEPLPARDEGPRTQVIPAVPAPTTPVPSASRPARTEAMPAAASAGPSPAGPAPTESMPRAGSAGPPGPRSTPAVTSPTGQAGPPSVTAHPGPPVASHARDDVATAAHPIVSTRVMPVVPPPRPAQPQPSYAPFQQPPSGFQQPAAAPPVRHGGAHPAPVAPAGAYPPPPGAPVGYGPRSRRVGTLLALGLLLVALTTYMPGLGLLVALGWSWLSRFVDRVVTAVALRRAERGVRDRDVPMAVLTSPLHLVGAGFSALVAGVLPLFVGLGLGAGLSALSGSVDGLPVGTASIVAVSAAAGWLVAWWGPGGMTLRRGSRTIVRGVAPGRAGAVMAVCLLLVAAAILGLMTQSSGWSLSWWPLENWWASVPYLGGGV